jgi:hypothetical protein
MKKAFTIILLILTFTSSFSQEIENRIVLEDRNDNILENIRDLYFNENGEFFYLKESDYGNFYITDKDTLKLPKRQGGIISMYGKYGEILTYYITKDSFYYKNPKSIKYFSGGYGKIITHITDFLNENVAITTEKNDSIFHFLNGKILSKNKKEDYGGFPNIEKWCAFSENGNSLHYINKNKKFYLYKNSILIDSASTRFIELQINNRGDVFYGVGKNGIPNTKFDYMFFPKHNEIKYDSVRTIWDSYINKNGGFYCSGGNPTYLLINGKYYKYPVAKDIILTNSEHFFFFDDIKKNYTYYTSNSFKKLGRKRIVKPSMDKKGDFAMFLKKGKKIEVLSNGKIQTDKIIGSPLAINSKGTFYTFKQSKKTTKIYRNNILIFEEFGNIKIYNRIEFFEKYLKEYGVKNTPIFDKDFTYFEIAHKGFIIWDGVVSEPLRKVTESTFGKEYPEIGELIFGKINEYGFYLFQYDGKKKTKLILNNKTYILEDEVNSIIEDSIFFNQNRIIFYAIVKNKVKRFEISE